MWFLMLWSLQSSPITGVSDANPGHAIPRLPTQKRPHNAQKRNLEARLAVFGIPDCHTTFNKAKVTTGDPPF